MHAQQGLLVWMLVDHHELWLLSLLPLAPGLRSFAYLDCTVDDVGVRRGCAELRVRLANLHETQC